jgi:flagellar hook-length control protein FliK
MQITDLLNGNISCLAKAAKAAKPQSNTSAGFDTLFVEAERRQGFEPSTEASNRGREDGRERSHETRERRGNDNQSVRRSKNNSQEDPTAAAGTAVINEAQQSNEIAAYNEVAVNEEEAVAKIAEIMQVPAEAVMAWLQELGLSAQDLTDAQAVAKMLQLALDAESPAELLTNEQFPEFYKAVNEAMSEMVAKANVKTEVVIDKDAVEAVAEELGVAVKESEMVVTRDNAGNENSQASLRQRAEAPVIEVMEVAEEDEAVEVSDATLLKADEATTNEQPAYNPATFSVEAATAKIEQAVKQAASQQSVNATDVIEQIMNHVKISSSGAQFNEIKMTLRPETLGDIVLRVITQNGIVMAQFEAENQRVKEALESNFNQLRDALQESGIKFSELSVFVRQDENERANQFERARQSVRNRAESVEDVSEAEEKISYHNGLIDVTA